VSLWAPLPRSVRPFRATGLASMADVTDDASGPRFTLESNGAPIAFVLCYMRAWATGGTGTATLSLKQKIVNEPGLFFNRVVREFPYFGAAGTDFVAFHNFRVQAGEFHGFYWGAGDYLVPEWANPNSGTTRWILEVGLAPAAQ